MYLARLRHSRIKVYANLNRLLAAGTARIEKRFLRVELTYTSSTEHMATSKYTPVILCFAAVLTEGARGSFRSSTTRCKSRTLPLFC
jgi:hypothetical protein